MLAFYPPSTILSLLKAFLFVGIVRTCTTSKSTFSVWIPPTDFFSFILVTFCCTLEEQVKSTLGFTRGNLSKICLIIDNVNRADVFAKSLGKPFSIDRGGTQLVGMS